MLAQLLLLYSFRVIYWKESDITKFDIKARKLLTMHHLHHSEADKHKLYILRTRARRGLVSIENSYKMSMCKPKYYFNSQTKTINKKITASKIYKNKQIVNIDPFKKKSKNYLIELDIKKYIKDFIDDNNKTDFKRKIKQKCQKMQKRYGYIVSKFFFYN